MRVHVVSDVHGSADALARAGDGADALICLGDLLLFVDYADHARGVLGELFGAEAVGRYVALRTARKGGLKRLRELGHGQEPSRTQRYSRTASTSPPRR